MYRVTFSTLFDDIYINTNFINYDEKKSKSKPNFEMVRVNFVSKSKMWLQEYHKQINDGESITYPFITIIPKEITYDENLQRNEMFKMFDADFINILQRENTDSVLDFFCPKPFKLNYEVVIVSKGLDNGLIVQDQILEQILPQLIPNYQYDLQVPLLKKYTCLVNFEGFNNENEYDFSFEKDRIIQSSLNFSQSAILYPIIKDKELIRKIYNSINIYGKKKLKDWKELEYII